MLDHSDFQDTDIPFEIPLPEKSHLTVSIVTQTFINQERNEHAYGLENAQLQLG